jgi:hypothetical protein
MATEEPNYSVTLKDHEFEVREYPALVTAEVTVSGERLEAANDGFRVLAGYIVGGNRRNEKIAMTTPVVQSLERADAEPHQISMVSAQAVEQGDQRDQRWTIRFVMPAGCSVESLPVPDDARVKLTAIPPTRFAVVRFSGLAHDPDIDHRTTTLTTFAADHDLRTVGPASLARYNPPWTLWFMRRNEVMIPLESNRSN